MSEVSIPEMMEVGAHFGHQTKRWNPKMRQYIYGARSGVHIINLQRTKTLANQALEVVTATVAAGKDVLFVGTKQQAREVIKEQAALAKQHYVNQRWMGGTLTNFKTIKKSIDRLITLQKRREDNDFEGLKKRELLEIDRTILKLEAALGGIKYMNGNPGLVFIVDPKQEHIAVLESRKLGVPVMAITDSNCDPELIDYVIPGNDDAIMSVEYFTKKVAEACLSGLEKREQLILMQEAKKAEAKKDEKPAKRARVNKGTDKADETDTKKTAYVARGAKNETFDGDNADAGFSVKAETEKAVEPSIKTEEEDGPVAEDKKAAG